MGVSEDRGPEYGSLNSRIFIIRPPNKVPLIFENSKPLFKGTLTVPLYYSNPLKEPLQEPVWGLRSRARYHTPAKPPKP